MQPILEYEKSADSDLSLKDMSESDQIAQNKKYTILIVDDNAANRIVLEGLLTKFGYGVLLAKNGQEAVDINREDHVDMVLMDVMMPVMDGYEATKIISSETVGDSKPILFLTAITDEDALAKCVDVGGDDFLSKPYSPVVLRAKIEAALRNRDVYQELQRQNRILHRREEEVAADLDIAERILSKITRKEAFDVKNINYYLSPMEKLNGDLIIVAHKPDGGQIYLLGDFTGHGLGAAIGGMVVFDVFKTMATKGFSLTQIASEINRKLREILPLGRFLAAGFVELNAEHTTATVWNGGLPDLYLVRNKSGEVTNIPSTNLPLGVLDSHELVFVADTFHIEQGDQFFLYSDGVVEAENYQDEFYGTARLDELVRDGKDTKNLFTIILKSVEDFSGGRPQTDDISLLEIICDPSRVGLKGQKMVTSAMLPATTWNMSFVANADLIRQVDLVPSLVQMIVDVQGLIHCQKTVYLIMTELYTNALEHGLLDVDARLKSATDDGFDRYYSARDKALAALTNGAITFDLKHVPYKKGGKLTLRISHDGDGFDVEATQSLLETFEENEQTHGRGIKLVESLTERLDYEDFGRVVEVDYIWEEE